MRKFILTFLCSCLYLFINAQLGVRLNTKDAENGYILFTSFNGTYLVDNCGGIVNKWLNVTQPQNHTKLLPNGNLLYLTRTNIREHDWNNKIVVDIKVETDNFYLDYEVIKLQNGNYLCVARKSTPISVFTKKGYNIGDNPNVSDIIIEVDKTGKVVWRWELLDHVVQNVSSSLENFGKINNPRKIDINSISTFDWNTIESFMINGMDYNPSLDQIVLSVRKINEIVIIDHSTTTAESKGSNGGKRGFGGDIIYRYGNPQNYGRGTENEHQLFFQHNPNWIEYGPYKDNIILFNNRLSKFDYSSVDIVNPSVDANGDYYIDDSKPFLPLNPLVAFNENTTNTFFESGYTSGAEVLSNGNIFITVGETGKLLEINKEGKKLWEYNVPDAGYIFRAEKYSEKYAAFSNKNLVPFGFVEFPKSSYNCTLFKTTNLEETPKDIEIKIHYSNKRISIFDIDNVDYILRNVSGKTIKNGLVNASIIDVNEVSQGMYFISFYLKDSIITKKVFIY